MIRLPKVKLRNVIAFIEALVKVTLVFSMKTVETTFQGGAIELACNWIAANDVWINAVCASVKFHLEWKGPRKK